MIEGKQKSCEESKDEDRLYFEGWKCQEKVKKTQERHFSFDLPYKSNDTYWADSLKSNETSKTCNWKTSTESGFYLLKWDSE